METQRCLRCKQTMSVEAFFKKANGVPGFRSVCRICFVTRKKLKRLSSGISDDRFAPWTEERMRVHMEGMARRRSYNGNGNPRSVLTPDLVKKIRHDAKTSKISFVSLAKKYGISNSTVSQVVHRATWKDV